MRRITRHPGDYASLHQIARRTARPQSIQTAISTLRVMSYKIADELRLSYLNCFQIWNIATL
jgi:hypothetical protein